MEQNQAEDEVDEGATTRLIFQWRIPENLENSCQVMMRMHFLTIVFRWIDIWPHSLHWLVWILDQLLQLLKVLPLFIRPENQQSQLIEHI